MHLTCGWRATYLDGSVLEERGASGAAARFEDVDRARLARFALVEHATGREVLGFDAATGVFAVRGRRVEFGLGDAMLSARPGASYRHVIQYKTGHSEWRGAAGPTGTVLDAYHVGYRAALEDVVFEVVLRLDARTGLIRLMADVAHHGSAKVDPFFALVDGRRVDTPREFAEALESSAPQAVRRGRR